MFAKVVESIEMPGQDPVTGSEFECKLMNKKLGEKSGAICDSIMATTYKSVGETWRVRVPV